MRARGSATALRAAPTVPTVEDRGSNWFQGGLDACARLRPHRL
jgi:hypothetical protein